MRSLLKKAARPLLAGMVAAGAYGVHYLARWERDPVPPRSGAVVLSAAADRARSPMLISRDARQSVWRVGVVTNRDLERGGPALHAASASSTLADQAALSAWETGVTTFGFVDVALSRSRERGTCVVEGGQPGVRTGSLSQADEEQFLSRLGELGQRCDDLDVLVFVHGFNVPFEHAVARTAQLAEDLPFSGLVIGFSWPSCAGTTDAVVSERYRRDGMVSERYFWSLGRLLARLRETLPAEARLHLLAHSMGNRVALRALSALNGDLLPTGQPVSLTSRTEVRSRFPYWAAWEAGRTGSPPLAEVVFAAPDVSAADFSDTVTRVGHLSQGMTLYASDVDVALEGSLKYNGEGYRAGDLRAQVRVSGLRVVEASRVSRKDPLGHSYYGSDPAVLDNLAILFQVDARKLGRMTVAEFAKTLKR